ncbi:MAG TPA: LysE family transporter [Candidatus Kapabacteria bacterium]|nr:LysE family transporter [Candidatus Kapabacteria bacterium]
MLIALVAGAIVSFGMAIIPGPIAVAVIRKALDDRYRDGLQIAISASGMDVVYALIAAFASSAIVSTARDAVASREWLIVLVQVVATVVLTVLGVRYFRATQKNAVETQRQEAQSEAKAKRLGMKSPYMVGLMIAVMNLASPTFLPTLTSIVGYIQGKEWIATDPWTNVAYAVGFGIGAFLWFYLLLGFLHSRRTRIPANFIGRIYKFAGITFLLFAAIIAWHVIIETRWSAVLAGG